MIIKLDRACEWVAVAIGEVDGSSSSLLLPPPTCYPMGPSNHFSLSPPCAEVLECSDECRPWQSLENVGPVTPLATLRFGLALGWWYPRFLGPQSSVLTQVSGMLMGKRLSTHKTQAKYTQHIKHRKVNTVHTVIHAPWKNFACVYACAHVCAWVGGCVGGCVLPC